MPVFSKTIGIVGGAGPMASAFLYTSILEVCQQKYQADDYKDFPEIVLVSYPFTRGNNVQTSHEISNCLSKLQRAGASLFCIASHSFHGSLPLVPETGFINLVSETLAEASLLNLKKALVLAAPKTIEFKLYETGTFTAVYPDERGQLIVNRLIREVAQGHVIEAQSDLLQEMISSLHQEQGFDGVILACTELPLIHRKKGLSLTIPILNSVEILSEKLVQAACLGF